MTVPNWVNPSRQAVLVKLFQQSSGFCTFGHYPCQGKWQTTTTTVCKWGNICSKPMPDGELCRYRPQDGKPHLPCQTLTVVVTKWHCAYGHSCYLPYDSHFEIYANRLIREWVSDDKGARLDNWKAESEKLHSLGETKEPIRGRFSNISREIILANQPTYYLDGLGISGLTFTPFAKIRIANTYLYIYVDLGNSLKAVSKNRRRKAIRHGKPLPQSATDTVAGKCSIAARHYLSR